MLLSIRASLSFVLCLCWQTVQGASTKGGRGAKGSIWLFCFDCAFWLLTKKSTGWAVDTLSGMRCIKAGKMPVSLVPPGLYDGVNVEEKEHLLIFWHSQQYLVGIWDKQRKQAEAMCLLY